ncbi:transcription-associated protein 1 [Pseudogymnoascus australis]
MSTFDLLAQKLTVDPGTILASRRFTPIDDNPNFRYLDIDSRIKAANQLFGDIKYYVSGSIYPKLLKMYIPIFISFLRCPPGFTSTSSEQKLRFCILQILHQLPKNPPGPFEPYAEDVAVLLISLVRLDNEENALLCIKTIIDLMRHQTKVLGDKSQQFVALTQHMSDQIKLVVANQLDSPLSESSQTHENPFRLDSSVAPTGLDLQQQTSPLRNAMDSFKVLAECPVIAHLICQVYYPWEFTGIKPLFLCVRDTLRLQAGYQERAHAAATAEGTVFVGVSADIRNRVVFGEFVTAQVKSLSLLAHLLRTEGLLTELTKLTEFNDFLPTIPQIAIRLLKDCPREKSDVRKELLMAIRSIINFNFRNLFLGRIGELLDERILIGKGLADDETLRPLAYNMLADLIYHVRDDLEPTQIRTTVEIYTKNLQDNSHGTYFQIMSVKLMLNMAEHIAKILDKVDARYYLIMILDAIGQTFAAVNKLSKLQRQQSNDAAPDNCLAGNEPVPGGDEINISNAMPIKTSYPRHCGTDSVGENILMFETIIGGLKNIFDLLKECYIGSPIDPKSAPVRREDTSYGFIADEIMVISKLFHEGANIFRYYQRDEPLAKSNCTALELMDSHLISGTEEEKVILEKFLAVLFCIHPSTLLDIFFEQIPTALGRAPQLRGTFPTLIEQYEQTIRNEAA